MLCDGVSVNTEMRRRGGGRRERGGGRRDRGRREERGRGERQMTYQVFIDLVMVYSQISGVKAQVCECVKE